VPEVPSKSIELPPTKQPALGFSEARVSKLQVQAIRASSTGKDVETVSLYSRSQFGRETVQYP
jgi:hypothetical protein